MQAELGGAGVAEGDEAEVPEAGAERRVGVGTVVGGAQGAVAGVVGPPGLARAHVLHQEGHAPKGPARREGDVDRRVVSAREHRQDPELGVELLEALARRRHQLARVELAAGDGRGLVGGVLFEPFGAHAGGPLRSRIETSN